ncbi:hypothetical protein HK405_001783 [Cladochytrium tenue]|nr:hypothetical protein HK405_001783 [Cladochytrium tenue]
MPPVRAEPRAKAARTPQRQRNRPPASAVDPIATVPVGVLADDSQEEDTGNGSARSARARARARTSAAAVAASPQGDRGLRSRARRRDARSSAADSTGATTADTVGGGTGSPGVADGDGGDGSGTGAGGDAAGGEAAQQFWVMKAEPESRLVKGVDVRFSIDELAAIGTSPWDGRCA